MNYVPETQWVGGEYPGVTPPHRHRAAKKVRYVSSNSSGHKRRAIVDYVRLNAPCNAVEVACAVGDPLDSVRTQLRLAFRMGLVTKEARTHENGTNKVMYYSGLQ